MRDLPRADDVIGTPTHCPTCHSHDVKTASKVVNASSYWRCGACGEVWNVGRLRAGNRFATPRGFRK
jgi:transposase-like protein